MATHNFFLWQCYFNMSLNLVNRFYQRCNNAKINKNETAALHVREKLLGLYITVTTKQFSQCPQAVHESNWTFKQLVEQHCKEPVNGQFEDCTKEVLPEVLTESSNRDLTHIQRRRRGQRLLKSVFIFYFGISHLLRSIQCVCRYQNLPPLNMLWMCSLWNRITKNYPLPLPPLFLDE